MRAVELTGAFGRENLSLVDLPDPAPRLGEVVLRMRAASLNYRDLLMVQGQYNPRQPLPLVPCSDGVGEVAAVGEGVTRFKLGDRACPVFAEGWLDGPPTPELAGRTRGGPLPGTLAEFRAVHQDNLVAVPPHLTDAEAACLPCAGLTAWSALVTLGGLKAGDAVLTQGTGGVSVFALQFARLHGAVVVQTSSSDEKLARAQALGAGELLNYRTTPGWGKKLRNRIDHVVEVGGAGTLEQSLQAVRPGGIVSLIGVLSGAAQPLSVLPILMRQVRVQGVFVGHKAGFEAMNRAIEASGLRPVVDRVFPLADTRAAFDYLASGAHFGKVVIDLG